MHIEHNAPLSRFTTFGINTNAKALTILRDITEINELQKLLSKYTSFLVLGGGSNILFTKDYDGIVIKNEIMGKELIAEHSDFVVVKFGAGENWDEVVAYTVENGWYGIENLSLIPGTVGASPMQNVGAYGQEVKDTIVEVNGFFLDTLQPFSFSNEECGFGYRDSIFKKELKGRVLITSVSFKLLKTGKLTVGYGAVKDEMEKREPNSELWDLRLIRETIIDIRKSKLPDPEQFGNAGSFFKNPEVEKSIYDEMLKTYPNCKAFPTVSGMVKVPAGWLIETAGWKGKRRGNVGTAPTQALVIINYGGATGEEVFNFSEQIINSVKEQFGITLEREVNIL